MSKIRILLADDHAVVRQGTRELLTREADLEVVAEAGDGEEAVRLARAHAPDVVIMDIAMPKLNGIQATRQIKAANPRISILALSAYDDDQYIFALLEAGAAGYLLKNVGADDLVRAIRAVAGAVAGLGQWLLLRPYLRKAGWWIPVSVLGWAVGWAVADAVGWTVSWTVGWAVARAVGWAVVGAVHLAVGGVLYGLLTGPVLLWLLRHPKANEARW